MTLMTLMTLMPLRGIQGHSVIQGHNYRLSNGCADRAKGPGQIEFVDCLHERCKRCCIVNYLNTHTSRAFALSLGSGIAASARVEPAEGERTQEGYSCPFSGN